jgi:hypothetical protein
MSSTDPAEEFLNKIKPAVVKVGHGRGFVVPGPFSSRYIITAAHCIQDAHQRAGLPKAHPARNLEEATYINLIGPLHGDGRQMIWAALCFVDPMSDIAVFHEPDGEELSDENEKYCEFTDEIEPIPVSATPLTVAEFGKAIDLPYPIKQPSETPAYVLALDGQWQRCGLHNSGRLVSVSVTEGLIQSGMSGSPIINTYGAAIALLSTSANLRGIGPDSSGIGPSLMDCLPRWLLTKMSLA